VFLFTFLAWALPAYALPGDSDQPADAFIPIQLKDNITLVNSRPALSLPATGVATATLEVEIVSSPWATLDSNDPTGIQGPVPKVFVVEAAITNTGTTTATDVVVELDFDDPANGWLLLTGEDSVRTLASLAPGTVYHVYWFASYPTTIGESHTYSVTAGAANADPVTTSENFFENPDDNTVKTRATNSTGNSGIVEVTSNVRVGVSFALTTTYDLGTNPQTAIFSPVGNLDFDAGAYRLLSTEAHFFSLDSGGQRTAEILTATDRLYFASLPDVSSHIEADVIYTFIALKPGNTGLCSYLAVKGGTGGSPPKYDQFYCDADRMVPITGTLTLSMTKQVNILTVEQDQILDYTIEYANTGDRAIEAGWIWDDIPTELVSLIPASISPASDPDKTTESRVVWELGAIPAAGEANSTGTLSFSVVVDGNGQDVSDSQELLNQASFGVLFEKTALTSTVTSDVVAPTVTISKTDGQETASPDDLLTYTIRIVNSGSVTATNLVITDVLPADVTLAGSTNPGFDTQNGQTLVWTVGSIAPHGGELALTIPVVVNVAADGTVLSNSAEVSYQNTAGHTFTTETATDQTTVQISKATLALSKIAADINGAPLVVGDTIRYTLQVTNTGTYTAFDIQVTDDLPAQVSCSDLFGDHDPGACADPLLWTIPSLAAGNSATLFVDVTVNPNTEGQSIINSASVTAFNVVDPVPEPVVCPDGGAPVDGQCSTTPDPSGTTLALSKTAADINGAPLVVGDTIRYTLHVTNTGTYTAFDIQVTDDLPAQVSCSDLFGDHDPGACADPLLWTIPSLAAGNSATLFVDVTVNPNTEGQSIINSASVTAFNVVDPVPEPVVCPDGSTPVDGQCEYVPEEPSPARGTTIFLPIIISNGN
jgi:uncharacterized repeat protein (TIGR01451 family)